MEFIRAGEALLRSTQPLLPFLAPAAYRGGAARSGAITQISRHSRVRQLSHSSSRSLSTSCIRGQQAAAARQVVNDDRSQPAPSSADDISELLNNALDGTKGTPSAPAGRSSHFKSSNAQREHEHGRQCPPSEHQDFPDRDKTTDFSAAFSELWLHDSSKPRDASPTIATRTKSTPSPSPFDRNFDRPDMITDLLENAHFNEITRPGTNAPPPPLPQPAPFKLGPTVGRTIEVNPQRGMDVGRALRTLEIRCNQNNVKKDFMRQRFHERPGLKRKRLKRERWRRNFKEKFKATVAMVQRMRKQGW